MYTLFLPRTFPVDKNGLKYAWISSIIYTRNDDVFAVWTGANGGTLYMSPPLEGSHAYIEKTVGHTTDTMTIPHKRSMVTMALPLADWHRMPKVARDAMTEFHWLGRPCPLADAAFQRFIEEHSPIYPREVASQHATP